MVGIFWASCPKCDGEFMAQSADFRGTENKMMCPFCGHWFLDTEASKIVEHGDRAGRKGGRL
jgi:ribosomal protein S27AE